MGSKGVLSISIAAAYFFLLIEYDYKNAEIFFGKQAEAFASRRGGARFRLWRVPFAPDQKSVGRAKHPTRKASGGQSLLEHNAPRLSGGAPKPQWRKERKFSFCPHHILESQNNSPQRASTDAYCGLCFFIGWASRWLGLPSPQSTV